MAPEDGGANPLPQATLQEARALAHPLRLRILRLANDESLTNKEFADRLGEDPGTTLHHVRTLVRAGFLESVAIRKGLRAWERPYRTTGRSWRIELGDTPESANVMLAAVDAFRAEASDPKRVMLHLTRLGMRLRTEDAEQLQRRAEDLAEEFYERADPTGEEVGILFAVHRPVRKKS